MVIRLSPRNLKERRRGTQMLPQRTRAGIGLARFRRGDAFDNQQGCAQGTVKFELLLLAFEAVRQQRQLVQRPLKLRSRFRHRRAGDGSATGPAPVGYRSLSQAGLSIMLSEKFGLVLHQLGEMGFKRFGDLRVQSLPRAAQQATVRRVLHQCVLEAVDGIGWRTYRAETPARKRRGGRERLAARPREARRRHAAGHRETRVRWRRRFAPPAGANPSGRAAPSANRAEWWGFRPPVHRSPASSWSVPRRTEARRRCDWRSGR